MTPQLDNRVRRSCQAVLKCLVILDCCGVFMGIGTAEAVTISDVRLALQEPDELLVTWTTDEPASSKVSWSAVGSSGSSNNGLQVTGHVSLITYRRPGSTYLVNVASTTDAGITASAGPFFIVTPGTDNSAPIIRNIRIHSVTSTSAVVGWEVSDYNSTAWIDYGVSPTYGQTLTAISGPLGAEGFRFTGVISDLTPSTTYRARIRAQDAAGNQQLWAITDITFKTDRVWKQWSMASEAGFYGSTCVGVGDAPGCSSPYRDIWPGELGWVGNRIMIHFNATAEDLTRGPLALKLVVNAVAQNSATRWVELEVSAGSDPQALELFQPGLLLDRPMTSWVLIDPDVLHTGLNYLQLRALTIDSRHLGEGGDAATAVFGPLSLALAGSVPPLLTNEGLLDQTEARAALYCWDMRGDNGFVRDSSNPNDEKLSIAATGFALGALVVMAERYGTSPEWTVTPAQAQARAWQILDAAIDIQTQQAADPTHYGTAGFLYHFIDETGIRWPGSEVSTVDTALLVTGALTAGQYFGAEVESLAAQLFDSLQWEYFFDQKSLRFRHAWKPSCGDFAIPAPGGGCFSGVPCGWSGEWDWPTDEVILINLLALASAPDRVEFEQSLYGWPRNVACYPPCVAGGIPLVHSYFGSLFTYLFGQIFFDFERMGEDEPIPGAPFGDPLMAVNWFVNAKRAVLANRAFAIDLAPNVSTYGPNQWGLSACFRADDSGYLGDNGALPAELLRHDGTVPPAGAIGSMPLMRTTDGELLSDNLSFQALRQYYMAHYPDLWGPYGPLDSLRSTKRYDQVTTQYSTRYLGINVGLEVLMIENYRSKLITRYFMSHSAIRQAVRAQFPAMRAGCVDADDDRDTDLADVGLFQRCFSGNHDASSEAGCDVLDAEGNGRIDLRDWELLFGCFAGPNRIGRGTCGGARTEWIAREHR